MKKLATALLTILITACIVVGISVFIRTGRSELTDEHLSAAAETTYTVADSDSEIRAVWISFMELDMKKASDKSKQAFSAKIDKMFSDIAKSRFNTVFLHVRPNSDAFYYSGIFPHTSYLTGEQGKDPGYDALETACVTAKKYGLKIHAWVNPFRVSGDTDFSVLSEANPAVGMLKDESKENDSWVWQLKNGIYYNPTIPEIHSLIIDGIEEIIKNYDVDGIHIDDYFYPTDDESVDKEQYNEYLAKGGRLPLDEWRRTCINAFVSAAYSAIKSVDNKLVFSISPTADIDKDYGTYYADVVSWCSGEGYCDIIIPQIYFGFENESFPFAATAEKWSDMATCPSVKVVYGLSIYKSGVRDNYAGAGCDEWLENSDIISKQVQYVRDLKRYDGFSLYSYSYAWGGNVCDTSAEEINGLLKIVE